MLESLPKELRGHRWLQFFSASKYIVLLYDQNGNPLWAANRRNHTHLEVVETLMRHNVTDLYHLPPGGLDNAIRAFSENHPDEKIRTADFAGIRDEDVLLERFAWFHSRNRFEEKIITPYFTIDYPLTLLRMVRLNARRFIGIVSFPDIVSVLSRAENKIAVFTDGEERIFGYNSLFAGYFSLEDARGLLNRPLGRVVEFSRPPKDEPLEIPALKAGPFSRWKAGDPAAFDVLGKGSALTAQAGGLLWENRHAHDYAHLVWKEKLAVDQHHVAVEIEFTGKPGEFPHLILRGLQPGHGYSLDITGYMLAGFNAPPQYRFKKAGEPVCCLTLPDPGATQRHVLTLQKTGRTYAFLMDGKPFGRWQETLPFMMQSDDLFYLVLRPGGRLMLHSVTLRKSPMEQPQEQKPGEPLLARFPGAAGNRRFHASFYQGVVENKNYTMYEFEDITYFDDNIAHLRKERERLATLLRQEKVLVGRSAGILSMRSKLETAAASNLAVLIEGETGTGKDLAAQYIHQSSGRRDKPLVKIDCSTIPSELMESALFGHEKGAFTGAASAHAGLFEQAQGGTVFLDEISNMTSGVQVKFLNVLQDFRFTRVGGSRPVDLDVRIIVATNVPLKELVARRQFRSDLFYRLNQVSFRLPPLRERREDIPLLADYFIREAGQTYKKKIRGLTEAALQKLYTAPWPGNVRELRNAILRAALFCKGEWVGPEDIALDSAVRETGHGAGPGRGAWGGSRKKCHVDKDSLSAALAASRGNVSRCGQALGISRDMVYRLLKRHGLAAAGFRPENGPIS